VTSDLALGFVLGALAMALCACTPILWRMWCERPRRSALTPEQQSELYLQHIEQHMNTIGGISSVARGDQQDEHARAHSELLRSGGAR
jgi:hypothetical protein